jgi:hypothetical protein
LQEGFGVMAAPVTTFDLIIPFRTANQDGFFNATGTHPRTILGHSVSLLIADPYLYLVVQNISHEEASAFLKSVRRLIPWAALRLDFSILLEPGEIQATDSLLFNGHLPTLVPHGNSAQPIRMATNHQSKEADSRLFSALSEANEIPLLTQPPPDGIVELALEILTLVDFEATPNAQFLSLTSALEILSRPGDRPQICIDLIHDMTARLDETIRSANPDEQQALKDMKTTATQFWIKQSFRSAIRALAIKTADRLGDPDPAASGKNAANLYDKRSKLIHRGQSVTTADVKQVRQLLREAIGVKLDCFHHIRERFPTA